MKPEQEVKYVSAQKRNDQLLKLRLRLLEFSPGHTLDELLQFTLDEICSYNGSPLGFYHFVEPNQTTLSLQAWSTGTLKEFSVLHEKGARFPVGENGVWVDCIRQQMPIILNHYPNVRQGQRSREKQAVTRELVVPVLRNELVVALLGVGNKSKPYHDADVRELSFLADVAWSMAAQKRTEQSLSESEELFRLLVQNSPVYTYIKDEQLRVVEVSKNFQQLLGIPINQIIGRRTEELFPPELAQKIHNDDMTVLVTGKPTEFEEEFEGQHFHSIKFPLNRGPKVYLAGHTLDFTERRQAQLALHRSEEHFRAFFENATVGMATIDQSKYFTCVNSVLCHLLGYSREELLHMTWMELTHPDDLTLSHERFDRTASDEINDMVNQKRYIRKDGTTVHAKTTLRCLRNSDGSIKYFIVLVEDISEQISTEKELNVTRRQLLQQDKMASIGLLASGIAHEINNPMGFITSNIATLRKYWDRVVVYIQALEDEILESSSQERAAGITAKKEALKIDRIRNELPKIIQESSEGSGRIKNIVTDLKRFVRNDDNSRMEPADLNQCIRSVINIVTNEIKYVATLRLVLGEIPLVTCNQQQISQVLMNLLVNAAQAITEKGEITVGSRTGNGMVSITVSDTGCGIPDEEMLLIFKPFYTTKEAGKGTGLGLSISTDIITKHGGTIQVMSTVGVGTTFTITLPVDGNATSAALP